MNPWPVAFCERLGESLRVWRAEEIGEAPQARPGEVARVSSAGIDIACKQGTLRLLEVQPAGKKRMTAGSYISGFRVQTGEIWTKE
jgi:methionyl-tRNA formyltransferase